MTKSVSGFAKRGSKVPDAQELGAVRERPKILRALGQNDPPTEIYISNVKYSRAEIYKHDSWAATALYVATTPNGSQHAGFSDATSSVQAKVVCKFNRIQPILFFSTRWLGRWLASREATAYQRLSSVGGIPQGGEPIVDALGESIPNAVSHAYVEGHPLGESEVVNDNFFQKLRIILSDVHQEGFAYVDLHKRENILVTSDGEPSLIDFQISLHPLPGLVRRLPFLLSIHRMFQASDDFCFGKHVRRLRPDQLAAFGYPLEAKPPWWIQLHRSVAVPFRQLRRGLLAFLRVRDRTGRSQSEQFPEHAMRCKS